MVLGIAIFVLIAFLFLYFGHLKEDYTTLIFSSIVFFLLGLNIYIFGVEGISEIYNQGLGIVFIGYGAYVGIRSGLELIRRGE